MMQAVNFGELQCILVKDGDPIFADGSAVIVDVKLDKEESSRPQLALEDFELTIEIVRLLSRLDDLTNGTIKSLEVRAGIPRRLLLEMRMQHFRIDSSWRT